MSKPLPPCEKCSKGTCTLPEHCMFIMHFLCFILAVKNRLFQGVSKLIDKVQIFYIVFLCKMSCLNGRAGQHFPKLGNTFLLGDHRKAFLLCNFTSFLSTAQLNACASRSTGIKLREIPFVCLFPTLV